ncbi:hypothetical protein PNOK_0372900 [Pyrrhoderma noxium]|uniref:DUF6741 domain-containing protein n=1 Tax=Pyrrhoderma noxium TaxID=2282107 RepID=A0A286UNG5_9AGAM|nr:hypothetical protein PNOK_0372900 [Pyrrhoderma noxium]
MAYGAAYPSQALTHSYSGRGGYTTPRTPAPFYDDYSRYPYGEPTYDDYVSDYAGRGDAYGSSYPSYSRSNSHYGAYDDLALNRHSSYYGNDLDYGTPYTTAYSAAGAVTPSRSRHASYDYRGSASRIRFRSKYSNSGMSLHEAVSGGRPSNGDFYKWHDIHADRNGEIYLKVAWTGYRTITYRVPVDYHEGRVRLSSLIRRVGRACIHYLQSNGISYAYDQVKVPAIEEVQYGVWQPQLTVKQY